MTFVNRTPIWFMRQAGRYLPEYMEIRSKNSDFLKLCFNPDLASEISLQPIRRFDLDFIILFSDILVIPYALGQEVKFLKNHGPHLNRISSKSDLNYTNLNKSLDKISNIFETIRILHAKKSKKKYKKKGMKVTRKVSLKGGAKKKERIVDMKKSDIQHKKYTAFIKNISTGKIRQIHFGDNRYQQFKDSTKLKKYMKYQHLNSILIKYQFLSFFLIFFKIYCLTDILFNKKILFIFFF